MPSMTLGLLKCPNSCLSLDIDFLCPRGPTCTQTPSCLISNIFYKPGYHNLFLGLGICLHGSLSFTWDPSIHHSHTSQSHILKKNIWKSSIEGRDRMFVCMYTYTYTYRNIFPLLVHSPYGHSSQLWARLKPRAWNVSRSLVWVADIPALGTSSTAFPRWLRGSWVWSEVSGTCTSTHMGC